MRRLPAYLGLGIVLSTLAVAYARTLAPGLTWANSGGDGGDLITAAATLGVAHPTGYPTYLLLAHLFQYVPIGDLAFRTNLLSAAAALLAAACVYGIVQELDGSQTWRSSVAAAIAALGLGLAPVFWSQAIIAEVYSLNACFVALILRFILRSMRSAGAARAWPDRFAALVVGVALGNHVTAALPALVWLTIATRSTAPGDRRHMTVRRLTWLCLGLLVYLYLPLRAAAHPPVNWGDAHDWSGFWWEISGQPYRGLAFGLPPAFLSGRVEAWAALLAGQFGWLGLGLGFFGLLYGGGAARWFRWLSAALAAAYSLFAVTYNTADSFAYLIPAYLIFTIWIGLGVTIILESLERWRPYAAPGAAVVLFILTLAAAPAAAHQVDASQDRRATKYASSVLTSAPRQAIVVTTSDLDSFPLWYYHYALGQRPDLVVIIDPMLDFSWYRENLRFVYPALRIPESTGTSWVDAIVSANRTHGPLCRTNVKVQPYLSCESVMDPLDWTDPKAW